MLCMYKENNFLSACAMVEESLEASADFVIDPL